MKKKIQHHKQRRFGIWINSQPQNYFSTKDDVYVFFLVNEWFFSTRMLGCYSDIV
mgnify:CR=1 FL=1